MPTALKDLDDKVLGRRRTAEEEPYPDEAPTRVVERTRESGQDARRRPPSTADGAREVLRVVARVSALVLVLLAAVIGLGALFLLAPTNPDNALVSGALDLADRVAGPFRDVFTADDDETQRVVNYAFAAGVHLVGAAVLSKVAGRLAR